jgi:CheY-like chemotaxis protein
MSHEIRTPINAVIGMTAIARRSKEKDKIADCLEKVSAASNQLLGLINDILDMSKIEAGKLELSPAPFFLRAALENLRSIIGVKAAEKDIALKFQIEGLPEAVDADETRFSQVLLNLLSNAVKFTPDGGKVVLSAKAAKTDDPLIDEYEFAIADSGIGMSEEEKSRLFKPFQQADSGIARRFGGTGLGLALSLRIAELMGGGISVKSEQGKGSVFTARVKMKKADAAELSSIKKGSETANYDFSGKTVLVAEDIEINREIVAGMLDGTGVAVVSAHNGKEAVEQFRAASDKFNLILMDMQMPEMDGLEATRQIRAIENDMHKKRTPIIAMTANAFNEDIERCIEAGMDDHIAKPVDMNLFLALAAKYLG